VTTVIHYSSVFIISVTLLALLTALIAIGYKLIFDYEHIPNLVPIESVKRKHFDYVIVGSGTAGSVIAHELSKNSNNTVLLIESGGLFNGLSIVPIMSTVMQGTEMDWKLKSTPQLFSSRGLKGERQFLPRGRGLGGSNQLNYLLHFAGSRDDFDEWQKMGVGAKWNYDNLECYLKRHDTDEACPHNDENVDTPKLSITSLEHTYSPLSAAFVRAQSELRKTLSSNVTLQLSKFTTRHGIRHTVFHEYLRRAYKHKNLFILVHATVERILFNERKEAVAVVVATQSQVAQISVSNEVILAAGAFHSPFILKRSGIGDEAELKSAGIHLVQHLPNVGENLFDHMNMPLFVSIEAAASVTKDKILSVREIYRFLVEGKGVLSTTAVIGSGRLDDYGVILFGMGSADEKALKDIANFKTKTFRAFFPLHANSSQEGFVALSTCYKPKSRGSIKLDLKKSGNDFLIDPEYLKNDDDMTCMRNAVKLNIKMIQSSAFQAIGAKIHWPKLRECQNFGPFADVEDYIPSDRYLDCLLRHAALTGHHPGGTCSLGSVVDDDLRVIGVKKLRVVDGSVIPFPVSSYPNTVLIAIVERAVKNILN
jgi:choline dehydrogenase